MTFKPLLPSLALSLLLGIPISDAAATEVDAAGYYKLRCATCHGVNGEGTRNKSPSLGPPLRGNPLIINAPAEVLANIIRHGRGGQQRAYDDAYPNMPAFDAGLVPDAVGLATYLKTVLQQQETTSHGSNYEGWQAPARVVAAKSTEDGAAVREAAPDRAPADHGQVQTQLVDPVRQPSLHLTE
jgi:mono/diheme cytochrome c family protein